MAKLPSDAEIDAAQNAANESVDEGKSNWPGMSYEQGVSNTIAWMKGESDENPMEDS
jgi:hypothetical protein